jgi:hypothetical protein
MVAKFSIATLEPADPSAVAPGTSMLEEQQE